MCLALALAVAFLPRNANAGYDFAGQGLSNVLSGSVANGNLFWSTVPAWQNNTPILPCTNEAAFTLPACDRITASRLVLTVWGGTADYACQMTVSVNGSNAPSANPFRFGTTTDTNAVFSATAPCAYGSGYGVWLVSLPLPGELLHTNATPNLVRVAMQSATGFDGRIQHVTLVAVYQSSALANTFDYALIEGSGDIRGTPSPPQADSRTAVFGAVNPTNATAATLTALYTYGDTGQNDMLFFNGTPLGGTDVSQWDASVTNFGPSVVSFDVLASLATANTVKFDVSAATVPDPRDGNLRPQFAALAVTRAAAAAIAPALSIAVRTNQVELTVTGESGRAYTVLSSTNLTDWVEADSFTSTNAVSRWSLPATNACRFFRIRAQ